jgi:uncharacterized protein YkuJ
MKTIKAGCLVKIKPDLTKTERSYTAISDMFDMAGEIHEVAYSSTTSKVSVRNVNTKNSWYFHRDDLIIIDDNEIEKNKPKQTKFNFNPEQLIF